MLEIRIMSYSVLLTIFRTLLVWQDSKVSQPSDWDTDIWTKIETHGSELRGQERTKQMPKSKHAMNYCVSFM